MATRVRFHFDPRCPWAWETSRWIREVAPLRDLEIEWRTFSLYLVNDQEAKLRDEADDGAAAMRTLALVSRTEGNEATGALYEAMGELVHEGDAGWSPDTIRKALAAAGLDERLLADALADGSTIDAVVADFRAAVDSVGCFGVPTIVLDGGKGIFGPVVTVAPTGDEAADLWDHVVALVEKDYFYELKRDRRDIRPGGRG